MTTAPTVGRREEADLKSGWASGRSTQLCTQHCHPGTVGAPRLPDWLRAGAM